MDLVDWQSGEYAFRRRHPRRWPASAASRSSAGSRRRGRASRPRSTATSCATACAACSSLEARRQRPDRQRASEDPGPGRARARPADQAVDVLQAGRERIAEVKRAVSLRLVDAVPLRHRRRVHARPFSGNQSRSFPTRAVSATAPCATLAREFNFAGDRLRAPARRPAARRRVRIFTPRTECRSPAIRPSAPPPSSRASVSRRPRQAPPPG